MLCKRTCEAAGRNISKALSGVLEAVRSKGVRKPVLFLEPESGKIFVMDSDHPGYLHADSCGAHGRQSAIVAVVPLTVTLDAGGW